MDGRCATCRSWVPLREGQDPAGKGWGYCQLSETEDGLYDSNSKMFAVDAESYYAALRTAPDFGCIQYEAKDNG